MTEDGRLLLGSGVVGAVTFPSLLAASQTGIFKQLRVSYRPGLTSSLLGLGSVLVASCGASLAAMKTIDILQQYLPVRRKLSTNVSTDLLLSTVGGVVLFRALGGRYNAVLPSNLMRPGVFAAESIPALRGSEPASHKEKVLIRTLGARHGCHSCGRRRGMTFVADHQPPSKLLGKHQNGNLKSTEADSILQWFYPQCQHCSSVQGGLLAGKNGMLAPKSLKAVRTHVTSLKLYHLFLPLPFMVAYIRSTTSQADGQESRDHKPDEKDGQKSNHLSVQTSEGEKHGSGQEPPLQTWLDVDVVLNSPLFIVWHKVMSFLDSFTNPLTAFNLTVWAFTIIAALGTI